MRETTSAQHPTAQERSRGDLNIQRRTKIGLSSDPRNLTINNEIRQMLPVSKLRALLKLFAAKIECLRNWLERPEALVSDLSACLAKGEVMARCAGSRRFS